MKNNRVSAALTCVLLLSSAPCVKGAKVVQNIEGYEPSRGTLQGIYMLDTPPLEEAPKLQQFINKNTGLPQLGLPKNLIDGHHYTPHVEHSDAGFQKAIDQSITDNTINENSNPVAVTPLGSVNMPNKANDEDLSCVKPQQKALSEVSSSSDSASVLPQLTTLSLQPLSDEDEEEENYYKRSAEQGNPDGYFYLGDFYIKKAEYSRLTLSPEDRLGLYDQAIKNYKAASLYKHMGAIGNLGKLYHKLAPPSMLDPDAAFYYYKLGALLEHPDSLFGLGVCYHDGIGTFEDKHETIRLYKRAARLGSKEALHNLGYSYAVGQQEGVEVNHNKAYGYFLAEQDSNTLTIVFPDYEEHMKQNKLNNKTIFPVYLINDPYGEEKGIDGIDLSIDHLIRALTDNDYVANIQVVHSTSDVNTLYANINFTKEEPNLSGDNRDSKQESPESLLEKSLNKNILEINVENIRDIKSIRPIQELIDFFKNNDFNWNLKIGASHEIALFHNTSYTKGDVSLLLEKAYAQMISILNKFYGLIPDIHKLLEANKQTPEVKTSFYKDSISTGAMIAFLNGCCMGMECDDTQIAQPINVVAETVLTTAPTTDASNVEFLKLIHVNNYDELLALSEEEFDQRIENIPENTPGLLGIKCDLSDIRVSLEFALQKKAEAEEADRLEEKWQEDTERFYKEARITKIVRNKDGEILWFDVEHDEDVP